MPLIEISVDSTESALAAEQGGAHHVELCSSLQEGGITPSLGLLRTTRSACSIPIFAMVRPRGGDFLYTETEFQAMQEDIRILAQEGIQGVVLGILTRDGGVDKQRTSALVELAGPLSVTFHRAFDMTVDLEEALEDVIACGAQRILTSGGCASAWQGRDTLRSLVHQSRGLVTITVGGGVRPDNVSALKDFTGASEFHSSMRRSVPSTMEHQPRHMSLGTPGTDEFARSIVSARQVEQLVRAAATIS